MAYTTTGNKTFTKTDAEKIASKIATDLFQFLRFYQFPSEKNIDDYVAELIILLAEGHLESVDYGFQKEGKWVLALHYEIYESTGSLKDDNAGRIPPGIDISGASWYSYLRKSKKFTALSTEQREKIEATIPIKRSGAPDPLSGLTGNYDKTYSATGVGADRKIIIKS